MTPKKIKAYNQKKIIVIRKKIKITEPIFFSK